MNPTDLPYGSTRPPLARVRPFPPDPALQTLFPRPARPAPSLALEVQEGTPTQDAGDRAVAALERLRAEALAEHGPEALTNIALTHPSLKLLVERRAEFGPAWGSVLRLAWACASSAEDHRLRAPHFLTTLWTLEEMTGKCRRTLERHLFEDGHRWSAAVRAFFDFRHNYGTLEGFDGNRTVIVGTVVRFFPDGRYAKSARVKRWGARDLNAEREAGRTASTREVMRGRYQRLHPRMSLSRPAQEQVSEHTWVFTCLETLSKTYEHPGSVNLDGDIPKNAVLDAMIADLGFRVEVARVMGFGVGKARAAWVEAAAPILAKLTRSCSFVGLWRRLLWVGIRAALAGTGHGWTMLNRLFRRALEAMHDARVRAPLAWALKLTREDGLTELERDYGRGGAQALPAGPRAHQFRAVVA